MLVCTPSPKPTESLFGYILRTSETNGYCTPRHILNYAGYGPNEMRSAVFNVKNLAKVLGRKPYDLKKITYLIDEKGQRAFKVLNHKLGIVLPKEFLRLKKPMLCPQCVQDQGFIDVFWDLYYAIACPIHKCQLLSVCPVCKQRLNWLRPGLLLCKCGANLADNNLKPVEIAVVELMAILKAKLHSNSIVNLPNTMKYPLKEMESTPLFSFVWMLAQLSKFSFLHQGLHETKDPYQAILEVSGILSNWPSGYCEFLHQLGRKIKEEGLSSTGLRKQFNKYYISMFKNRLHPTEEIAFLRNEFISFGLHSWGMAIVDNKLVENADILIDSRFAPKSKISDNLGISPKTLKNWIEKGLIPNEKVTVGKRVKYILDKKSLDLVKRIPGKILNDRKAAAFLQIPVSVLISLKITGHYSIKHLPKYINGFHEEDLKVFAQKLLIKAPVIPKKNLNNTFFSLDYILQEKRFWSKKGKASIVAAYLDGEILSIGRTSDSIKDIWLQKIDVEKFLSNCRMKTNDNTVSQVEAAKLIDCMVYAIPVLISNGFLIGLPGPNRVRVKHESVNKFSNQYLSFSSLSIKLNTSPKRLLALCQKTGVEVLNLETEKGNITTFIKKEKVSLLKYHIARNPTREEERKVASQNNVSSLMRLQYYLKHLRKKDIFLPRIGFKPNSSGIAKACGVPRHVFYDNPEAVKLLEAFDVDERERKGIKNRDDVGDLKNYLDNLKRSGTPIPMSRRGRPNKLAIADACGINRNIFYKSQEATTILKRYISNVNRLENQKPYGLKALKET